MEKKIKLEVLASAKSFYKGEVVSIIIKTVDGYEEFLPNHSPACMLLGDGELKIKEKDTFKVAKISGGFIEVLEEKTIVFTDVAEWD